MKLVHLASKPGRKKKGRTGDGCRREVSSHRDRLESLASSIAFFK